MHDDPPTTRRGFARGLLALGAALSERDVADGITQFGLEPAASTPAELAAMRKADHAEWRELIRKVGFSAES